MKCIVKIINRLVIYSLLSTAVSMHAQEFPCNGHAELCNRRYNQVTYAQAHNSPSYTPSAVRNQDKSIPEQLAAGIRVLKTHVYLDTDANGQLRPMACHGIAKQLLFKNYYDQVFDMIPKGLGFDSVVAGIKKLADPVYQLLTRALAIAYGKPGQEGTIPFTPCIVEPGSIAFEQVLAEIKTFLDNNPGEIVSLIIESSLGAGDDQTYAQLFQNTGLIDYVHTQDRTQPWPTLGTMIEANKRLVVFNVSSTQYPWLNSPGLFSSDYDFQSKDQLLTSTGFTKNAYWASRYEEPKLAVFEVQSFLTPLLGGTIAGAKEVNARTVLRERVRKLMLAADHIANFIGVDFFEYPNNDIFDVVDEVNGVGKYAGKPLIDFSAKW